MVRLWGAVVMSDPSTIRRSQLTRQAEGYLELGMPQHALTTLARLEMFCSLDSAAQYLRGEALRSLDRWEEALPWLRAAASGDPENIHIWLALGWCYKRTGQLRRAIDALENGLEVDPSEAILHYNLACYWSLARNKEHALDYLSQAFEIDPNYRDMVHDEADFDLLRNDADFQALTSVIV
jgi:tetratricopeptide (TPR) repeat protein